MSPLRVLVDGRAPQIDPAGQRDVHDDDLPALYAVPRTPWLRANMVSTVDGAATGADGRSGSINNDTDKEVFHLLRRLADAIVVGAGTARAEGYGPAVRPIVLVSRQADVPERLRQAPSGSVLMATCAAAPLLQVSRAILGDDNVLVVGESTVDLAEMSSRLHARGLASLLCEGGPSLLGTLIAAGLVDELCATSVPRIVGGDSARITRGGPLDVGLELRLLLEDDGTMLARWFVVR